MNHYRTNEYIRNCLQVRNQSLRSRVLGSINRFFIRMRRIYG